MVVCEIEYTRGLPLSTYALRGRGGIGPNADVVLRLSKRGCVNLRTRRRRGSKKPENLRTRTYLMDAPLAMINSDGVRICDLW